MGQGKGIQIAAKTSSTEPLYVIKLNAADNTLIVGPITALGQRMARVPVMHYVSGVAPSKPLRCTAKIRYKAKEAAGVLTPQPNGSAIFESMKRSVM